MATLLLSSFVFLVVVIFGAVVAGFALGGMSTLSVLLAALSAAGALSSLSVSPSSGPFSALSLAILLSLLSAVVKAGKGEEMLDDKTRT